MLKIIEEAREIVESYNAPYFNVLKQTPALIWASILENDAGTI